jgi:translation initiation factor IF-2
MGVKLLGKIKIHELAKELSLTSKEIIAKAKELGIDVKTHMSAIEENEAEKIKKELNNKSEKTAKKTEKKDNKKQSSPVIIRREVIISDEEEGKQSKNNKSNEQNGKPVGFVERNKNADYNIVYRNKPTKPMTVSELFGIGKKEEPKKEETKKEEIKKEVKGETKKEENMAVIEQKRTETKEKNIELETPKVENKNLNNNNKENNFKNRDMNRNNNFQNRNNNFQARDNQNRNSNFSNRENQNRNSNYSYKDNQNRNGNFSNRDGQNKRGNFSNRDNQNRNGDFQNRNNNFQNKNNFRSNQGKSNFNREKRPLDEKGIDRNIKDIMTTDIVEKENVRDFNSRAIDKAKSERLEEKTKKVNKNKKGGRFGSEEFDGGKLKDLKQVDRLSNMFDDQEGGMLDYYDLTTARGKRNKKKVVNKNEEERKQKIFKLTEISIPETITVKDLAAELKKTSAEIIKKLFSYGIMATINNDVDFDTAFLVAEEFGVTAIKKQEVKEEDILFDDSEDKADELTTRPPVVVVMGHVDHGKTSLLDAIRQTNVIEGEAGGITQAIGAYQVNVNGREITFLDTPGHEAFTSMRARGAQITDIAILVVAANDGVMPQTVEAINHAKAAGIPIIVAINKIDLPDANIDKVKQEMMKYELVPEEWGGDTIYVPISAKKRINIDELLEMVLLQADVLELKANPKKQAKGVVIEARLDKTKGPIATMLVQRGSLDVGDTIVVGSAIGRIRAMKNDKGQKVKSAGPSTPVEIMGLTEVPESGDIFYEVKDEKMAKHLIERRKRAQREKSINNTTKVTLDNLFTQMEQGNLKRLNIIVKADVQGSCEALKQSLEKLSDEEVSVNVIHSATGAVNESDVNLAQVANAIIIAFNVRPVPTAKTLAERNEIEIKQYSVIYQAIDDVKSAMKGMLDPIFEEKVIGNVEVRQTFKVSNVGTIAGAYVLDGKIERNAGVRVIRENVVIHEGKLVSLKRFKDDVKEVAKGYECGMQIENYNDIKEGDIIEVYIMEEIKR